MTNNNHQDNTTSTTTTTTHSQQNNQKSEREQTNIQTTPANSLNDLPPNSQFPSRLTKPGKQLTPQQKHLFEQLKLQVEKQCQADPVWEAERTWLLGTDQESREAQHLGLLRALIIRGKSSNILRTLEKGVQRRRSEATQRGEPHPGPPRQATPPITPLPATQDSLTDHINRRPIDFSTEPSSPVAQPTNPSALEPTDQPAQLRSPFAPKTGQELGPSCVSNHNDTQGRTEREPSHLPPNLALWSPQSTSPSHLKLVSAAEIIALPPIVSLAFVQRYYAYYVAVALIQLYQQNNLQPPDSVIVNSHKLKLRMDKPWETLKENFLLAHRLFTSNRDAGAKPNGSLRSFVIPFKNLEKINQEAITFQEQARQEAQAYFDSLPIGPRVTNSLSQPPSLPSPLTSASRAQSTAPSHENQNPSHPPLNLVSTHSAHDSTQHEKQLVTNEQLENLTPVLHGPQVTGDQESDTPQATVDQQLNRPQATIDQESIHLQPTDAKDNTTTQSTPPHPPPPTQDRSQMPPDHESGEADPVDLEGRREQSLGSMNPVPNHTNPAVSPTSPDIPVYALPHAAANKPVMQASPLPPTPGSASHLPVLVKSNDPDTPTSLPSGSGLPMMTSTATHQPEHNRIPEAVDPHAPFNHQTASQPSPLDWRIPHRLSIPPSAQSSPFSALQQHHLQQLRLQRYQLQKQQQQQQHQHQLQLPHQQLLQQNYQRQQQPQPNQQHQQPQQLQQRGNFYLQGSPTQPGYRRNSHPIAVNGNQESVPIGGELLRRPIQQPYSGSTVGLTSRLENYPLINSTSPIAAAHPLPQEVRPPPLTELQLQAIHSHELVSLEQQYFRCINEVEARFKKYMHTHSDPTLRIQAVQLRDQQFTRGKGQYEQFMFHTIARHHAEIQSHRARIHQHPFRPPPQSVLGPTTLDPLSQSPSNQPITPTHLHHPPPLHPDDSSLTLNDDDQEMPILSSTAHGRKRTFSHSSTHPHPSSSSSPSSSLSPSESFRHLPASLPNTEPDALAHKRARNHHQMNILLQVGRALDIDWRSTDPPLAPPSSLQLDQPTRATLLPPSSSLQSQVIPQNSSDNQPIVEPELTPATDGTVSLKTNKELEPGDVDGEAITSENLAMVAGDQGETGMPKSARSFLSIAPAESPEDQPEQNESIDATEVADLTPRLDCVPLPDQSTEKTKEDGDLEDQHSARPSDVSPAPEASQSISSSSTSMLPSTTVDKQNPSTADDLASSVHQPSSPSPPSIPPLDPHPSNPPPASSAVESGDTFTFPKTQLLFTARLSPSSYASNNPPLLQKSNPNTLSSGSSTPISFFDIALPSVKPSDPSRTSPPHLHHPSHPLCSVGLDDEDKWFSIELPK